MIEKQYWNIDVLDSTGIITKERELDIEATLDVIIAHLNKQAEALAARDKIKEILK